MQWSPGLTLERVEKDCILQALNFFENNKTRTAEALGICPRTLDNKLARYRNDESGTARAENYSNGNSGGDTQGTPGGSCQGQKGPEVPQAGLGTQEGVHVQPPLKPSEEPSLSLRKRQEIQKMSPKQSAKNGA